VQLAHSGLALKQMLPDGAEAGAVEQTAELLWQGYRFWDAGRRLYVVSDEVLQRLVAANAQVGHWRFAAPPACYVQLPAPRLWARVAAEAPFEPVDGFFVAARTLSGTVHELRILAVLGLRRERPGVSLVAHRAVLDDGELAAHADSPWRDGAAPFANAIPGGERMGYYTLVTASELEALAIRVLHHLDTHSRELGAAPGTGRDNETRLAHVTVE
jgi:hypothetical protein